METRYQKYKDQNYKQYLLINEPAAFGSPPTATYCKQIRDDYGLTFPVLYDPSGTFTSTFGFAGKNEQNLVLKQGGEIIFKDRYKGDEVKSALEAVLE